MSPCPSGADATSGIDICSCRQWSPVFTGQELIKTGVKKLKQSHNPECVFITVTDIFSFSVAG
jgi:hypothetical protein